MTPGESSEFFSIAVLAEPCHYGSFGRGSALLPTGLRSAYVPGYARTGWLYLLEGTRAIRKPTPLPRLSGVLAPRPAESQLTGLNQLPPRYARYEPSTAP